MSNGNILTTAEMVAVMTAISLWKSDLEKRLSDPCEVQRKIDRERLSELSSAQEKLRRAEIID